MKRRRAGWTRLGAAAMAALMLASAAGPLLPAARALAAEADAGAGTEPQVGEALRTGDIAIDETNFPDEKFRELVTKEYDTDNRESAWRPCRSS